MARQETLYPVLEIIAKGRKGIKGDSGEAIIKRVQEAKVCLDHDRQLITSAAITWLMENCERYKYCSTSSSFRTFNRVVVVFVVQSLSDVRILSHYSQKLKKIHGEHEEPSTVVFFATEQISPLKRHA